MAHLSFVFIFSTAGVLATTYASFTRVRVATDSTDALEPALLAHSTTLSVAIALILVVHALQLAFWPPSIALASALASFTLLHFFIRGCAAGSHYL